MPRPVQPSNAMLPATFAAWRAISACVSATSPSERRRRLHQTDLYALHTDKLYVQIAHAPQQNAARLSFRTCRGRDDHAGGRDNAVCLQSIGSPEGYASLVATLRVVAGRRS
ncbi:hypothetical protein LMG23994_05211 [Cupriavidus pinatubonensis]|uniref:Uncharacterized protein n=1 Tax=Cupriavidus pinatubonensis TaxID=248026 RepID=A0ABN7ZHT5_9BURK|nr:hypothetical protein LMG23994_05211 [Cupriavidus pinatubonensis]